MTTGAERRPDRDAVHGSPAGMGRAAAHRSPEGTGLAAAHSSPEGGR
ncbi:hypothetical protein ACWEPR_31685 [Streptomyces sp. NPDC004290]